MTYKEISKEFLDKANVTIGDTMLMLPLVIQ